MELKVNVSDYLSEEEVKDIARSAVHDAVKEQVYDLFDSEEKIRRVLVNTAYTMLEEEVDKIVPDYKEQIANEVKRVLTKKDLNYEIFYKKDIYGTDDSAAIKYINETIKANKQNIMDKIKSTIDNYDVKQFVIDAFNQSIEDMSDKFGNVADMLYNLKKG